MLTKEKLINQIKEANISSTDTILIHSSLKSLGYVDGGAKTIVEAFVEVVNNGLLIFPTHTWGVIKEDGQIFDVKNTKSNLGLIPNAALETNKFIRSNHPTHSVCAYGKKAKEYVMFDNTSTTPCSPNGCFGQLKNMNAKILFLGTPLSKNTFIHSIEEEMNVPDRFTNHIYNFKTLDYNDNVIEFYMPRHYSTKSAHISDHYEKLLPILLENDACVKVYLGDSTSYLVDATKCYNIVKELLANNIGTFDDFTPIK